MGLWCFSHGGLYYIDLLFCLILVLICLGYDLCISWVWFGLLLIGLFCRCLLFLHVVVLVLCLLVLFWLVVVTIIIICVLFFVWVCVTGLATLIVLFVIACLGLLISLLVFYFAMLIELVIYTCGWFNSVVPPLSLLLFYYY